VVLIAGGLGKGQDFAPLAKAAGAHARAVVLIGQDAALIEQALAGVQAHVERAPSLAQAVARSLELAQAGDTVLLSPACASMDMFNNYGHRGRCFVAEVDELALSRGEVA
jgi:UDP-N-acetylmuramoylalanine--D-glutamate ligase